MRIDAHHHFWRYSPDEYNWIDDSMNVLRRDFLPTDLAAEIAGSGVEGVISVQARQMMAETEWLLTMASGRPWIRGVVGWAPLAEANVPALLDRLAAHPELRGFRHVLQAEPDSYMERTDFNAGLSHLHRLGLAFDILIYHHQLPAAIRLVDRHPHQIFVLDHIAKPDIRGGSLQPWASNLGEMARRPNVFCKLSGVVTEADYGAWSYAHILPFMETALAAFGPERTMFGSDWPVCRVATTYAGWIDTVERFTASLSADEQRALFAETATRAYRLTAV